MRRLVHLVAAALGVALVSASVVASEPGRPASGASDPLRPWRQDVRVHPVSERPGRHTLHSYYVCNPESPDGKSVLYYTSTRADGHAGDLAIRDRSSGKETVLVRGVNTEDAHRGACQQWISGGRRVAFHDVRDGRWRVAVVDVDSRAQRVLAEDRQLGFGQPAGDLLPIYGCHWNPGAHRDLELVDAATGTLQTAVRIGSVLDRYGAYVDKEFGSREISIFFPVLSPDSRRVFFKLSRGSGNDDFRTAKASHRQGLVGFDLEQHRLLFLREKWGHPAWHPDSRRILEVGNLLIDSNDGAIRRIPDAPQLRGCHPSMSPDGALFVMDGLLGPLGEEPNQWGVVVADIRGHHYQVLHRFDNSRGARSWRRSHPHPAFSADGRRIYFNVSSGDWTELYVAEAGARENAS